MRDSSCQDKRQLRQDCQQIRSGLAAEIRRQASESICRHIEAWPTFQHATVISAFLPMRGEVDLRPLLERHPEKRWALPRILAEGGMVFHPYIPNRLVRHPFGMLEPSPDLPILPPDEIELALVPALAYDRHGWRLGYGGGYYDRFLAVFRGVSLGIAYHALLLDDLPHRAHDIPVEFIVTEIGLTAC